jgi:hypothetical protein
MNLITLSKIADIYAIFCAFFKNKLHLKILIPVRVFFYEIVFEKLFFDKKPHQFNLKTS